MTQTQMRKFDAILALKDGRIEESGCFDALMEQRGYFYGLFLIGK
jgi:ATP-binding cassette subfamily B protein